MRFSGKFTRNSRPTTADVPQQTRNRQYTSCHLLLLTHHPSFFTSSHPMMPPKQATPRKQTHNQTQIRKALSSSSSNTTSTSSPARKRENKSYFRWNDETTATMLKLRLELGYSRTRLQIWSVRPTKVWRLVRGSSCHR